MIRVAPGVQLDESELREQFIRSSGPGGQNVNKVATAVQLRVDVARAPGIAPQVRERLVRLAGRRMTLDGVLVIDARRFRTRERNREDARERLFKLLGRAAECPLPRKSTHPTAASRERRLAAKRRQAQAKRRRQSVDSGED